MGIAMLMTEGSTEGATITSLDTDEGVNRNCSCTEIRGKGLFMEDTPYKPAILAVSSTKYPPFAPALYIAKITIKSIPSVKSSKKKEGTLGIKKTF